jgi:hypothetical protein
MLDVCPLVPRWRAHFGTQRHPDDKGGAVSEARRHNRKESRKRPAQEGRVMLKKQKALTDIADNEDWLDGKITTMVKA